MSNSTTPRNTSNLEDDPLGASILIVFLMIPTFYIGYRLLCLIILWISHSKNMPRFGGWPRKMGMIAFPPLFSLLMVFRSTTSWANNACELLVPLSYLIRFGVHSVTLTYQLFALLPIKIDPQILQKRPGSFLPWISLVLFSVLPTILVILMYILRLGIAFNGVCTLGYADGSDIIKIGDYKLGLWAAGVEAIELFYVIINVIVEIILHLSKSLGAISKWELAGITRASTALIVYDVLFRFQFFNYPLGKILPPSDFRNIVFKIWGMIFTIVYVSGLSVLLGHFLCLPQIWYFRLHPFNPRFWRLLFCQETISRNELEKCYTECKKFGHLYMLKTFIRCFIRDEQKPEKQNQEVPPSPKSPKSNEDLELPLTMSSDSPLPGSSSAAQQKLAEQLMLQPDSPVPPETPVTNIVSIVFPEEPVKVSEPQIAEQNKVPESPIENTTTTTGDE